MKFRVYSMLQKRYLNGDFYLNQTAGLFIITSKRAIKLDSKLFVVEISTGLKDKNGVEIYEGDTITSTGYPWIDEGKPNYVADVEWIFAGFQYVKRCVNPNKRGISNGISETLEEGECFEVIGTIHDEE